MVNTKLYIVAEDVNYALPQAKGVKDREPSASNTFSVKKSMTKEESGNVMSAEPKAAPVQLSNGKWACNHKCKDKTA